MLFDRIALLITKSRKFDAIIITAAPNEIPKSLIEQLKTHGRMIMPLNKNGKQILIRIKNTPDIIIIGCGDTQILPSPNFINNFTSQNIGIEIMTTESACKTFNVLISEHRKVVAGLTL